jgi:hypothetical protein
LITQKIFKLICYSLYYNIHLLYLLAGGSSLAAPLFLGWLLAALEAAPFALETPLDGFSLS